MTQATYPQVLSVIQIMLGGIRTDCLSSLALIKLMVDDCLYSRTAVEPVVPRLVFDTNGHAVSLAALNISYRTALKCADVIHADGQPLVAFSKLFRGGNIPHRTATTDMIVDCARAAAEQGLSFYLLGGTEAVNAAAARTLQVQFPDLKITGRRNGYFTIDEEPAICEQINGSKADVVWVGLGKPAEQLFCVRNAGLVKCGWLVTCGGCFNFLAGAYRRAPKILQSLGLEWLHRVVVNPSRQLAWRYVTSIPIAIVVMLVASHSMPLRGIKPLEPKAKNAVVLKLQPEANR